MRIMLKTRQQKSATQTLPTTGNAIVNVKKRKMRPSVFGNFHALVLGVVWYRRASW